MKLLIIIGLFLFLGLVSTENNKKGNKLAQTSNGLATSLYKELMKEPGNVFFSPLSIHTILSLLSLGSKGSTNAEFHQVLGLNRASPLSVSETYQSLLKALKSNDGQLVLDIANRIYVANSVRVKDQFKNYAQKYFFAGIQNVDFGARQESSKIINDWVSQQTHNKINEMVQPADLGGSVRMVLLNAIYFNGKWAKKFDVKDTKMATFHGKHGNKAVPMMHTKGKFSFTVDEELKSSWIFELPYKGEVNTVMTIVLPKKGVDLSEVEKLIDVKYISNLETYPEDQFSITIPKFKIEATIPLNGHLQKIGLNEMFSSKANFGELSDESLVVSDVFQKSFIEVNEEGSEAAASTAVLMGRSAGLDAVVDRPFLFFIKEVSTKAVLFMGRVQDL